MNKDFCNLNFNDERFSSMTEEDKAALKEQLDKMVDNAVRQSKSIEATLEEFDKWVDVAARVKKITAYRNKLAFNNLVNSALGPYNYSPAEGVEAALVGIQRDVEGSRNSVANTIDNYTYRYLGILREKLFKADLMREARSGKYDKDIVEAMYRLHRGESLDGLNENAVEIARIFNDVNTYKRNDANEVGAMIGELEGFVVHRRHDMYQIRNNKEGWKQFMRDNIDRERTSLNYDKFEEWLEKQWSEFSSGVHIADSVNFDDPAPALTGFASIAKAMSKHQVVHFKSPANDYEYMRKFGGVHSLYESLISNIRIDARRNAMMHRLGPNAQMNISNAIRHVQNEMNKAGRYEEVQKLSKLQSHIDRNILPVLTGASSIPGNEIGATVYSIVASALRTASLGAMSIASLIGDTINNGINVARLEQSNGAFFSGMFDFLSGLGRNLKDPKTLEHMADMGVTSNYSMLAFNPRYADGVGAINKVEKTLEGWENLFYFMTGQTYLDDHFRYSASLGMSARFAVHSDKAFDALPSEFQKVLFHHSITPAEWDIIRSSTSDLNGDKVISVEGIRDMSDKIKEHVVSQNLKATDFNIKRITRDIIYKFRGLLQDQQGYSIVAADKSADAKLIGGTKRGTLEGTFWRAIFMFKKYPYSFMQKVWGREIYDSNPMRVKMMRLAAITLAASIGGYAQLQLSELRKGKTPKPFSGGLVGDSLMRGGGLGIYGDFFYTIGRERMLSEGVIKELGPMAKESVELAETLKFLATREYKQASKSGLNVVKGVTPFANHILLKPALDYLFFNSLQELVDPGSLRRIENKSRQSYGNDYFMLRPSETMLFK